MEKDGLSYVPSMESQSEDCTMWRNRFHNLVDSLHAILGIECPTAEASGELIIDALKRTMEDANAVYILKSTLKSIVHISGMSIDKYEMSFTNRNYKPFFDDYRAHFAKLEGYQKVAQESAKELTELRTQLRYAKFTDEDLLKAVVKATEELDEWRNVYKFLSPHSGGEILSPEDAAKYIKTLRESVIEAEEDARETIDIARDAEREAKSSEEDAYRKIREWTEAMVKFRTAICAHTGLIEEDMGGVADTCQTVLLYINSLKRRVIDATITSSVAKSKGNSSDKDTSEEQRKVYNLSSELHGVTVQLEESRKMIRSLEAEKDVLRAKVDTLQNTVWGLEEAEKLEPTMQANVPEKLRQLQSWILNTSKRKAIEVSDVQQILSRMEDILEAMAV